MPPIVDKQMVHQVEMVLKDLIETGFADNCDEELLHFDEDGKLVKIEKGASEVPGNAYMDEVMTYKGLNGSRSEASVSHSQFNQRPCMSVMSSVYQDDDSNMGGTPNKPKHAAASSVVSNPISLQPTEKPTTKISLPMNIQFLPEPEADQTEQELDDDQPENFEQYF